jgi:hypothetical protein
MPQDEGIRMKMSKRKEHKDESWQAQEPSENKK